MIVIDYTYKNIDEIQLSIRSTGDSYLRIGNDCIINDFIFLEKCININKIEINKKIPITFTNSMLGLHEVFGKGCRLDCQISNEHLEILKGIWTSKFSLSPNCKNLKVLGISNCKNAQSFFSDLNVINSIKTLDLGSFNIVDFLNYSTQPNVISLSITKFRTLKDLNGLSLLFPNLEFLKIEYANNLMNYLELEKMKKLRTLIINKSGNIKNLNFCKSLTNLKDIRIVSTRIEDKPNEEILKLLKNYDNIGLYEV